MRGVKILSAVFSLADHEFI